MTRSAWAEVVYLAAAVCFILALKGLSSPRGARRGNLLGAGGAAVALLAVVLDERPSHLGWILATVAVGALVGTVMSRRVAMTAMPQLVAIFNGVGGGAAALVASLELAEVSRFRSSSLTFGSFGTTSGHWFSYDPSPIPRIEGPDRLAAILNGLTPGSLAATSFTLLVGSVSLSGSLVTFAKLQELMTTRPVTFRGGPVAFGAGLSLAVLLGLWVVATGWVVPGILLAVVGLTVGVLLVLPVGGADVPVVISLLNAFTGLAVAAAGYVLGNPLLLVAGTLVGASGTILTRAMATAMGRSVRGILFGAFRAPISSGGGAGAGARAVRSATPEDVAILLAYARRVVVVPGYGLAVAQAQHTAHELVEVLQERGVEVAYGIHAVAGRMPGHMNVLLAEANVPYEQLLEMDPANAMLRRADVALVIGANDVVNPAAKTTPGSPIYGMPILDVANARAVVLLKRSMRPGFAGIDNELMFDSRTSLLFGDAKESLNRLVSAVKSV